MNKSILAVSILLTASLCFSQDQGQSVTCKGQAAIIGGNVDAAKTKALSDALRNAVEKGLGVWVQSNSETKNFMLVKDQILSRSEGYVTDHEILNESTENGMYIVTISAKVSVDKIGADFKALVGREKTQMNNPTISFVLTTWDKKGSSGSFSQTSNEAIEGKENVDQQGSVNMKEAGSYSGKEGLSSSENATMGIQSESENGSELSGHQSYNGAASRTASVSNSYNGTGATSSSTSIDAKKKTENSGSYFKIDESVWKKYPDPTIIDAFQQEFKEKGFDLKAADKARAIAMSESMAKTSIDPNDRAAVRELAEKEGANYVARGEATVLNASKSTNTGNYDVTVKVGVEIIDVNSGDIVASYSNTATSSNQSEDEARAQAIKKIAVLAARTLADQTISTWQDRILTGRQYTIEIRNIKSVRSQKIPIIRAIEALAQITSQTSPEPTSLLISVLYKGDKNSFGIALLEALGDKPGFGEKEFDGPKDESGKIVYEFLK